MQATARTLLLVLAFSAASAQEPAATRYLPNMSQPVWDGAQAAAQSALSLESDAIKHRLADAADMLGIDTSQGWGPALEQALKNAGSKYPKMAADLARLGQIEQQKRPYYDMEGWPEAEDARESIFVPKEEALANSLQNPASLTPAQAEEILKEFYFDFGHPCLNYQWGMGVARMIGRAAGDPQVPSEALNILRKGLVDYCDEVEKAGMPTPYFGSVLTNALLEVSNGEDEAWQRAEPLYYRTLSQMEGLGLNDERELFLALTRNKVNMRYELRNAVVLAPPDENPSASAEDEDNRYRRAQADPQEAKQLLILALGGQGGKLDEAGVLKWLVWAKQILAGSRRTSTTEMVKAIDAGLVSIAAKQDISQNLISKWCETARFMRGRASSQLRDSVQQLIKRQKDQRTAARLGLLTVQRALSAQDKVQDKAQDKEEPKAKRTITEPGTAARKQP
jgi:hypothetical protein